MSKVASHADVQARLAGVAYPVKWPNIPLTPPVDTVTGDPLPYLVVELRGASSQPIELGGSTWQDEGATWVHVLVPVNSGVDDAYAIVDDIIARFRLPSTGPLVYKEIADDPGDPGDDNGNYWRTSIVALWYFQNYVQGS